MTASPTAWTRGGRERDPRRGKLSGRMGSPWSAPTFLSTGGRKCLRPRIASDAQRWVATWAVTGLCFSRIDYRHVLGYLSPPPRSSEREVTWGPHAGLTGSLGGWRQPSPVPVGTSWWPTATARVTARATPRAPPGGRDSTAAETMSAPVAVLSSPGQPAQKKCRAEVQHDSVARPSLAVLFQRGPANQSWNQVAHRGDRFLRAAWGKQQSHGPRPDHASVRAGTGVAFQCGRPPRQRSKK